MKTRLSLLSVAMLVATSVAASAQERVIASSTSVRSVTCQSGDSVRVTGSANLVNIHGPCDALIIEGQGNAVTIDSVHRVTLTGNLNHVAYRGGQPDVGTAGTLDIVSPALVDPDSVKTSAQSLVVTDASYQEPGTDPGAWRDEGRGLAATVDHRTYVGTCDGKGVTIAANGTHVTLHGACGTVEINGDDNRVSVDSARSVSMRGSHNIVRCAARPHTVKNSGSDNVLATRD